MKHLAFALIVCISTFLSVSYLVTDHNPQQYNTFRPPSISKPLANILLIPLDNRPPCFEFPQQLAHLAGAAVTAPPDELLGFYHTPAKRQQLINWIFEHAAQSDALLLSADMLVHGGLVPSRLPLGNQQDYDAVLKLLQQLHDLYPDKPILVFSVIPRLIVADDINKKYQPLMLQYSLLREQQEVFYDYTATELLHYVNTFIPSDLRHRYERLYQQNTRFNLALIDLARQQVITQVLLGQDDTIRFGLSHMEKETLSSYLTNYPELGDRVSLIRATDEIAACLTARILLGNKQKSPKIYVQYGQPQFENIVMPYMPYPVGDIIQEKIKLMYGEQVNAPGLADLVLYIHIGTATTTPEQLQREAIQVQTLMQHQLPVALVDLSQDFKQNQCLFPHLLHQNIDLSRLVSYSGWNTTSNSVGTALSQGCLVTQFLISGELDQAHALQGLIAHHEFLLSRMLDDWYFEKILQPDWNRLLTKNDIDPYNIGTYNVHVNQQLDNEISQYANILFKRYWANQPILLSTTEGTLPVYPTGITVNSRLPWDRTFEIQIAPQIMFNQHNKHI